MCACAYERLIGYTSNLYRISHLRVPVTVNNAAAEEIAFPHKTGACCLFIYHNNNFLLNYNQTNFLFGMYIFFNCKYKCCKIATCDVDLSPKCSVFLS